MMAPMSTPTKHRLLTLYFTLAILLAPVIALAKQEDEDAQKLEARLEGYATQVRMTTGSTSLTWILIGFLSALCLATLFKNAKRTHLD
jgi:hypothetical protein